jgi:spore coat polysaccharide biosynthesis protein SpsF
VTPDDRRVVAIIQARMTSTRLPGKVLAPIGEWTALGLLLHRLRFAREVDDIVIATSDEPSDDAVEREAARCSVPVVRGPLQDVLRRYLIASDAVGGDAVVRITADCPFSDPDVIDGVVACWRATEADYVANILAPRTYPDGFDVEVLSTTTLHRLGELASTPADREHVTTYIRSHRNRFTVAELRLEPSFGGIRVTLDTAADLRLMQQLIADVGPDASMAQVLEALGHDTSALAVHRT